MSTTQIGIKLSLDGASQTEASLRRVSGGLDGVGQSAANIKQALGGLAGAFAGVVSVREFVAAADAVTTLQNNLRLATGSAQAAGVAYEQLFAIAQRSRTNFTELGNTFASIARASESLGLSQQALLSLTETIGNAVTVSGASAQASQAALMQLGQGLASGTLRGEELNSILEQTPRLAKALADGLGVSTGALRKLGEQGKLTAEAVVQALRSQQSVLAEEVQTSVTTVGQAFTQLKNAATVAVGDFDKASGSTGALATGLQAVATTIGDLRTAFNSVADTGQDFTAFGEGVAAVLRIVTLGATTTLAGLQQLGVGLAGLAAAGTALATGGGLSGAREALRMAGEDIDRIGGKWEAQANAILNSAGTVKRASEINAQAMARMARQGNDASTAIKPLNFRGLVDGAGGAKKAIKELGDEFASQRDAAKAWASQITDFQKIGAAALAEAENMTRAEAALKGYLESAAYLEDVAQGRQNEVLAAAALALENERLADTTKAVAAAEKERAQVEQALIDAQNQSTASVAAKLQGLKDEEAALAIAAAQNISLAQALEEVEMARLREQQAALMRAGDRDAEVLAIQAEIDARKKLKDAIGSKEARDAAAQTAKDAAAEWQRASQQIEQSITDALMRGFESGKGIAQALIDTLVNMFKTLVLRPIISAVVNPVAGAITGSLGIPGAASAATTGGSAMGWAGAAGAFGTGAGAAFTSIVQAGVSGWATAAGSLIGTGTASGIAAGLGMFAGPFMGLLAVGSLLSGLDDSGTLHTGGMASYSATGGLQTSTEHGAFGMGFGGVERGDGTIKMTGGLARSTVGMLDSTAQLFGGKGGYSVATGFADDTSKDGAWGGLLIKDADGNTKVNWNDDRTSRWAPREFADGETGAKEYGLAVAKDVRDVLIEETPMWADTMLNALGDAPTLEQLAETVAQIHAAAAAFDTMGRASAQFADLSESAMDALITAMGGAEAAVAGLGSYYSNFFSDTERADVTRGQLQDKFTNLGLGALPQTREQFRAVVESLDLTTESGRAMYAELIKLSPAFASITAASQDAGAAMAAAVEETARAAKEALEKAKSAAFSQLEASVQRERALWEQQATAAAALRDEVRGVFDTLATNIRELRNEALGPELTAAQGQAFIDSAIAAVQAGAGLPDNEALANAIAAVRGGIGNQGMYANSVEREFAALRLAGELAVLQTAAGEQLTTAELQLQAAEDQIDLLDETLAYWRKLIDGTEDGIDATKSVEEAVKALTRLMFPVDDAASGAGTATKPAAPGFGPGGGGGPSTVAQGANSRLGNTYYGALGTPINDAAYVDRFDSVNTYVNTLDWSDANKGASAAALTNAALEYGVSAREISIATGMPQADVEALLPGIPRYLLGTNYVPADGLAFLHRGEQVIPAPQGMPYQPPVVPDNTQVVALLQQIAARVGALESHAATSADANTQTAGVLTRVTQGDAITTAAAPTIA